MIGDPLKSEKCDCHAWVIGIIGHGPRMAAISCIYVTFTMTEFRLLVKSRGFAYLPFHA